MAEKTRILVLKLLPEGWFLERPEDDRVFLGPPEADPNLMLAEANHLARDSEMVVVRGPSIRD